MRHRATAASSATRWCADPRVRKVSFTGSTAMGEAIARIAGVKRLSLELGACCPVGDPAGRGHRARRPGGRARRLRQRRAGVHLGPAGARRPRDRRRLPRRPRPARWRPSAPATRRQTPTSGTLISEGEAAGSQTRCIDDAAAGGARVLTGGERDGAVVAPAVVADVDPDRRSPGRAVRARGRGEQRGRTGTRRSRWPTAPLRPVGAGIFTGDVANAVRCAARSTPATCTSTGRRCGAPTSCPTAASRAAGSARRARAGRSAEMTEVKTVVLHGRPW